MIVLCVTGSSLAEADYKVVTIINSATLDAAEAAAPADRVSDQPIKHVVSAEGNLGIGVVHRPLVEAGSPIRAIQHHKQSEVYRVMSGSGTLVTSRSMSDNEALDPAGYVVTNLTGPSDVGIINDVEHSQLIGEGDVVIIPRAHRSRKTGRTQVSTSLNGKVCLVTGASRGIGAAIAAGMADMGARVIVHFGRNEELAKQVAEELQGDDHLVLGSDLADPAAASGFINDVVAQAGRIDVLVNNAGIYSPHPPLEVGADEWLESWQKTLSVNLVSPAALCHAAANVMAKQGGGRIVNVGSRGAFRGEPDCPAYGASKAGLHAMSQSLAVALAPKGVFVYAVAPGWVATDMAQEFLDSEAGAGIKAQSPMGRVTRPEEIAETVCFLASSDAEFLTGAIVDVNGASYLRH
jgi:NAD(P)-dependent dehydrogenase (short-subunit alcohol dehydrogenase family)